MKALLALISCLLLASDVPDPFRSVAVLKPADDLTGTWKLVSREMSAGKVPFDAMVTFTMDKMNVAEKGKARPEMYPYKADYAPEPRTIDIKADGKELRGIYRTTGNKLFICVDNKGGQRPTAFKVGPNSDLVLLTLERTGN